MYTDLAKNCVEWFDKAKAEKQWQNDGFLLAGLEYSCECEIAVYCKISNRFDNQTGVIHVDLVATGTLYDFPDQTQIFSQ